MNATCNNHGNRIAIENYKQPLGCYCVEPDIAYSHYVPESSLEYNKMAVELVVELVVETAVEMAVEMAVGMAV